LGPIELVERLPSVSKQAVCCVCVYRVCVVCVYRSALTYPLPLTRSLLARDLTVNLLRAGFWAKCPFLLSLPIEVGT